MRFPISYIDIELYKAKINDLLEDPECIIFLDTNIIALFFGINDSARKDFFDWLKTLINQDRVKLPVWVVNEYTNRFIRNKLGDYTHPLKKISTIGKEYEQVDEFLKKYIQESNLSNSDYETVNDFQEDVKTISDKLKKVQPVTKSRINNERIHDEIQTEFENCILNTDLDEILSKVNELGLIRYKHKLPPGFQDNKKELNEFGDLILWYEILDFCKNNDKQKAILLTNDEKKDWVYPPYKILRNQKKINNAKDDLFKIVDPRLVHEFKSSTDSEEFHIINFEFLTKILIQNKGNSFNNLASALQLSNGLRIEVPVQQSKKSATNTQAPTTNKQSTSTTSESISSVKYSEYALFDKDFPLTNNDFLTKTIIKLQSYNWYKQNPAIEEMIEYDYSNLETNQTNTDLLFVLGRNIYQSAIGASASAIEFIENLRNYFKSKSDYFINHVFSGMVYEIYFNSENDFRGDNLKSYYIENLVALFDNPRLKESISFIKLSLKKYEQQLIFLPYTTENIIFDIDIKESERKLWEGTTEKVYLVNEITVNDKKLLISDESKSLNVYLGSLNYLGLIDLVCKTYAIPNNRITLTEKIKKLDKEISVIIKDKKLATTLAIINTGFGA